MGGTGRKLGDLISIGPAMLRDFERLGIRSVAQLARQNPQRMYDRLSHLTRHRQDPCVLDTFCAAVAQARNPRLAAEKCQWWYWSKKRKMSTNSKLKVWKRERHPH
jgi:Pathogenicity locus